MFKLIDSIPYINQLFFDTAKVKTAADKVTLQKGGFVYLDTASGPGMQKFCTVPTATNCSDAVTALNTGLGANLQKVKLIYPIFISRPQDANFNPIGDNDMITFINGTNYEGWLTSDSYKAADTFAAGLPLILASVDVGSGVYRPQLSVLPVDTDSTTNLSQVIVAYALSAVVNNEVKIKWVA